MGLVELEVFLVTPATLVLLIMGLAEVAKNLGLAGKYIPLFDVLVGMIMSMLLFAYGQGMPVPTALVIGLAIGLAACGLFSGIKNTIEGFVAPATTDEESDTDEE